jgi:hypothetical protein
MLDRPVLSMDTGAVHAGLAEAGLVETSSRPRESTATQRRVEAQDTLLNEVSLSTVLVFQLGVVAVGLVEIATSPALFTATHSDVDGHERPEVIPSLRAP